MKNQATDVALGIYFEHVRVLLEQLKVNYYFALEKCGLKQ